MKKIIKIFFRGFIIAYVLYGLVLLGINFDTIMLNGKEETVLPLGLFDGLAVICGIFVFGLLCFFIPIAIYGVIFTFIAWVFKNE